MNNNNTSEFQRCTCIRCKNPTNIQNGVLICNVCMKKKDVCQYCGRPFANPTSLRVHIKKQHPNEDPPTKSTRGYDRYNYRCLGCSYETKRKHDMVKHIRCRHPVRNPNTMMVRDILSEKRRSRHTRNDTSIEPPLLSCTPPPTSPIRPDEEPDPPRVVRKDMIWDTTRRVIQFGANDCLACGQIYMKCTCIVDRHSIDMSVLMSL